MSPVLHNVLFVCSANYYRSRYAELFFNFKKSLNVRWTAQSRGFRTNPKNIGSIAKEVITRLEVLKFKSATPFRLPLTLCEEDLKTAARIVVLDETEHRPYMARLFPTWTTRVNYWQVPDVELLPAEKALPLIEANVEVLLQSL